MQDSVSEEKVKSTYAQFKSLSQESLQSKANDLEMLALKLDYEHATELDRGSDRLAKSSDLIN